MPSKLSGEIGAIPILRLSLLNDRPPKAEGEFVVYWMTAARRTRWNFALQRAVGWARELKRPLVIIEVLACGGRWDSDRHHRFVLQGMSDNARQLADAPALYYPYVEPQPGECRRLFAAALRSGLRGRDRRLSDCTARGENGGRGGACPRREDRRQRTAASAGSGSGVSDGLCVSAIPSTHLARAPARCAQVRPFREGGTAAPEVVAGANSAALAGRLSSTAGRRVGGSRGAADRPQRAARARPLAARRPPMPAGGRSWRRNWPPTPELRNQPEAEATSGLAPYLHFGHISAHEIFHSLARQEGWSPGKLAEKATGSREGWWGMSEPAEAFLDQLVTWREVGFNCCATSIGLRRVPVTASLGQGDAGETRKGQSPPTPTRMDEFASAQTHDPLWNAAQRQLVTEGHIHNYLRMLWGKKILEWTASPQEALDIMIELNNRYALDGQDPNSYSGIFWILGRYDRPWGPERPIFGTVRYMSSENTARKVRVADYIRRYSAEALARPREEPGD